MNRPLSALLKKRLDVWELARSGFGKAWIRLRCKELQRARLTKDIVDSIRAGHPWVFDRAISFAKRGPAPGDIVMIEHRGEPVALAYADPGSPIAARIVSLDTDATIDRDWIRMRVERARRARDIVVGTDAMRLVHGENDFLPGLVLDRYADVGALVFDGEAATALWQPHADLIRESARVQAPKRAIVHISEHGARFEVDLERGQKTGLFLDQRDNRMRVREMAAGQRVLNLFCYTGGFSIHAAMGGARQVTSVDQAAPAMAAFERNLALNELDRDAHELHTDDVFTFLKRAAQQDRRWDIVVCDPPSFAPSAKTKSRAQKAYHRLNSLAAAVVEPGGVLVSASCSSHISHDDLLAVLARVPRRLRVVHIGGAGVDHPVAPAFPEGRYLKCMFCVVD